MRLTSPFVIELTGEERQELEYPAVSRTAPFGQVQRASVVLALAAGASNAQVSREAGRHLDTIRAWRKRFAVERPAALVDRPRPLGRPRLSPEDRLRIIAAATAAPPGADTVWTHRLLAEQPHLSGLAVPASQVGRILDAVDLKPHLVRGRLTRPADPEFFTRAADVCDLYRRCPDNAVVISVDEKTGITARSRKHPDLPGSPGRRTRREFEYVRHGTVSIVSPPWTSTPARSSPRRSHSTTPTPSSGSCAPSTPRSRPARTSTWSWTTARRTPPRRPAPGSRPGLDSTSTTPRNTPPG